MMIPQPIRPARINGRYYPGAGKTNVTADSSRLGIPAAELEDLLECFTPTDARLFGNALQTAIQFARRSLSSPNATGTRRAGQTVSVFGSTRTGRPAMNTRNQLKVGRATARSRSFEHPFSNGEHASTPSAVRRFGSWLPSRTSYRIGAEAFRWVRGRIWSMKEAAAHGVRRREEGCNPKSPRRH